MSGQRVAARTTIFLAIAGLGALLIFSGVSVWTRLQAFSTAQGDNTQWTITQAETELAGLTAELADTAAEQNFDQAAVRLQANLALSRLSLLQSGRAHMLLAASAEARGYLDEIGDYFTRVATRLDSVETLSTDDIQFLRIETDQIRNVVRRLAVEGVLVSAAEAEERREDVLAQLRLTGGSVAVLILVLATILIILDRLLARARDRDRAVMSTSDRLASTVAASLDAIVVADETGKIIEFNASAERIFGWARDEILGQSMEQTIIPPAFREAHAKGMQRFLNTREKRVVDGGRVELSALRKGGEEFPVELNITSVQDGPNTTFIAYLRDISDRRKNEASLIEARDRAEKADQAKSRFLAVMSHEMRTPLNGILGVLDLMRNGGLSERNSRYVDIATASGEILLEHINEALDITRIESGEHVLSVQNFELDKLVASVTDVLRPLAEEKGLPIVLNHEADADWSYRGDSLRVRQILTNILGNAIKFTQDGGIDVQLKRQPGLGRDLVILAVRDTGPGIGTEDIERVFEDFVELGHRADGRLKRGDGLGLAISRRIARQMEGDLALTSQTGVGSTFTLTLPLTKNNHSSHENPSVQSQSPEAATTPLNILIVEDNGTNRTVLRDMLEGMGHVVAEARDGIEAVQVTATQSFDAILMDLSMPKMDGIEATTRIRSAVGPNTATPIYGVTAHGTEAHKEAGMAAGMTGFYAKPVRLASLKSLLSGVAHSDDQATPEDLNVDPLSDLARAIGTASVVKAMDQFFEEFDREIPKLGPGGENAEQPARDAVIHQLRGAAVMLGLDGISEDLERAGGARLSAETLAGISNRAHDRRRAAMSLLATLDN